MTSSVDDHNINWNRSCNVRRRFVRSSPRGKSIETLGRSWDFGRLISIVDLLEFYLTVFYFGNVLSISQNSNGVDKVVAVIDALKELIQQ